MQYRNKVNYILGFFVSVLIIPVFLFTSIELVTFHRGFYIQQYSRLNTAENIGIEYQELLRVTWELLDYIRGDRDTLGDIEAEIQGVRVSVFNQREIDHMVDVKELFHFGYSLRDIALLSIFLLFMILYYNSKHRPLPYFARSYLVAATLLLALSVLLFLLIQSNFTYYWDQFHYIFFDNDLWMLDPATDILINMVPEPFFYSAVTRVLVYFCSGMLAVGAFSIWLLQRFRGNHLHKKNRTTGNR